jgi:hypothetical protein
VTFGRSGDHVFLPSPGRPHLVGVFCRPARIRTQATLSPINTLATVKTLLTPTPIEIAARLEGRLAGRRGGLAVAGGVPILKDFGPKQYQSEGGWALDTGRPGDVWGKSRDLPSDFPRRKRLTVDATLRNHYARRRGWDSLVGSCPFFDTRSVPAGLGAV